MTVGELIAELEKHDPNLIVRYEYDSGFSYPTFKRVELNGDELGRCQGFFVCLYEDNDDA